jgi:hypothetical protein
MYTLANANTHVLTYTHIRTHTHAQRTQIADAPLQEFLEIHLAYAPDGIEICARAVCEKTHTHREI